MKLPYGGDSSNIHEYTCCSSSGVVMGIELLVSEILSRLPAKSLMRFKCVCKQWQSLIQRDRSFIDLHLTRSKTSCNFAVGGISLFIKWPTWHSFDFSSVELILSQGRVETVRREVPGPRTSYGTHIFGAVNGLIAFVKRQMRSVCIFNPSTGQSTPWIQSMIRQQHESLYEKIQVIDEYGHCVTRQIQYVNSNWYYFGYDPVTMEHKVVCIWKKMIYKRHGEFLRFENICEVMTVDGRQHNKNNLSWRRIDNEFVIPPTISPSDFSCSLYINGSIYWLCTGEEPLVVEFNVGSEKFRVISIPNYIIKEIRYCDCKLIQIDGRLAVLAATTKWLGNNTPSMKMCVLYGKKLKDIISSNVTSTSTAAGSSGDFYWAEETFMMPPFDWSHLMFDSIQAVPGTDLLIIRSEEDAGSTFYFYRWRKKSFCKDGQIFVAKTKLQPYLFEHFVYKGSLLPVI
ncbi:hypothetical protein MKX03_022873 [Papaver bracteatum]|nr:hypothetical protein MKX03_022873 [Papaver bracteatum]